MFHFSKIALKQFKVGAKSFVWSLEENNNYYCLACYVFDSLDCINTQLLISLAFEYLDYTS